MRKVTAIIAFLAVAAFAGSACATFSSDGWSPTGTSNVNELQAFTITLNTAVNPLDTASVVPSAAYVNKGSSCSGGELFGSIDVTKTGGVPASTITFTPTAGYSSGGQYIICVKSGETGIRDTENVQLDFDAMHAFTVRDYLGPYLENKEPTVATAATLPAIILAFSEAMNQSTVDTDSVTLFNITDNAYVSLSGPTWSENKATFTPVSALTSLKTYQVTLDGSQKDAAGNIIDCSSSACSWTFNADQRPTVTRYSPDTAYVNSANPEISARFSQAIDQNTLGKSSFSVTALDGNISYDSSTDTATYSPSTSLSDGVTYTVALTTAIKDTAKPANSLAQAYTWRFTVDLTAPVVSFVSPSSGATGIYTFTPISITFSEATGMAPLSMNSSSVTVSNGTSNIPCSFSYSTTTGTLTLMPANGLENSKTYTVTLSSGVTDLGGNPLSQYSWSFTTQPVTANEYTAYPPFMVNPVKPNVLVILDNSNSMDEAMNHYAVGSPHCSNTSDSNTCSKSILARQAINSLINVYANKMRIGLMSYKLNAASKYFLHHAPYFTSYERRSHCPTPVKECYDYCVQEDPREGNSAYTPSADESACTTACRTGNSLFQANYREPILTEKGTNQNGTEKNSPERETYCSLIYPKYNVYKDPNDVEIYYGVPGTLYSSKNEGTKYAFSQNYKSSQHPVQDDSYRVCTGMQGGTDKYQGYTGCAGPYNFVPSDGDFAVGFYDFGQRLSWTYTSRTWFSKSSPGGGYLNVPVADNIPPGNTQLTALMTALGTNRTPPAFQNDETGYMECTNTSNPNACSYIINAGLTPTAGTLQSTIDYFKGTLVQGGSTLTSPIQYPCQKNFVIYVTDGLPSVGIDGKTGTAANLLAGVLDKIDALRCPINSTSSNCEVKIGTTRHDVKTYVLGMALSESDQVNLDLMAVHGGTATAAGEAYYAGNPTELVNALIAIFEDISQGLASGTAASILNNSQGSGSSLLQAAFYPTKSFDLGTVDWIGEMHNLWYYLDPKMQNVTIREDSVQDNVLNLRQDKIAHFDSISGQTYVKLYSDGNGDGVADNPAVPDSIVTPDKVKSLWKAGQLLWRRNVATDKRVLYSGYASSIGATPKKFSSVDSDGFVTDSTVWDLLQVPAVTDRKAKAIKLINYISGADQDNDSDGTIYRSRKVTQYNCGLSDSQACTREWKLGDIISSTPRLVSNLPLGTYDHTAPNGYGDSSYLNFTKSDTYQKRGMVFVGANDGMLHAFRLGTLKELNGKIAKAEIINAEDGSLATASTMLGKEEWAFIPESALPFLKYYADVDYDHIFTVDRTPTIVDASIGVPVGCSGDYSTCSKMDKDNPTWRTVLIGGMGFGGASRLAGGSCNSTVNGIPNCIKSPIAETGLSSYFALDVTDPKNPKYLWEFSGDASGNLGASTSGPAIVRLAARDVNGNPDNTKNGKWYAIFASGPTGPIDSATHQFLGYSDQELKLFVVDLATGTLVKTFNTGIENAFAGSLATGVIDTDRWNATSPGFYSDDAVYIGYTQLDSGSGAWTKGGVLRLTTADWYDPTTTDEQKKWRVSTLISDTGPVTTSLTKLQDRKNKTLWLYFGTGRFFYKGDDQSTTVRQRLYGLKEPCYYTSDRKMAAPVAGGSENDIDKKCEDEVSGTLVDQSNAPQTVAVTAPGWYLKLDAADSTYLSERVITDSVATTGGAVFFTTFKPSADACKFGGDSLIWALRYDTGGVPPAKVMKGKALLQVSTGAFQEISLSEAFKNPGDSRLDGRRLSTVISGVPPTSQGLSLLVNPKPVKKILHIKEK